MKYRELYEAGSAVLTEAGVEEAALDARLLLEWICHTNRNTLLAHGDSEVEDEAKERYLQMIDRRAQRIPLQQITGVQEFMGLEFFVNENVLIPRQDTEILVEEVLRELHDGMRILDLCTGSGCILISLLCYSNGCSGVGTDICEDALKVAEENAGRLLAGHDAGSDKEHSRIHWIRGDLFEGVSGRFEFIISNPPYIPAAVCETLMPEVRDHEPRLALDGGEDGLLFYRRIVKEAPGFLAGGGRLYLEIGYDQAEDVSGLMRESGYRDVHVVKDYAGHDRVVYGTYVE